MLGVRRIAVLADHRLSPRSIGIRALTSRAVGPGVRVVGLTNAAAAVRGGRRRSARVGSGVRVVGRSPVRAAVRSVGRASVAVSSGVGVVGVVAVGRGVGVVKSAVHIGRIVIAGAAGHDGSHRGAHDEHSHVSRGVAGRDVAVGGRHLGHVGDVVDRRTGRNGVDDLRHGLRHLPRPLRR